MFKHEEVQTKPTLKAIILAGGRGTRLQSEWKGPKCLVPVNGVPVIDYVRDALSKLEMQCPPTILLNYKYEQVLDHLWHSAWGRHFMYIHDNWIGQVDGVKSVAVTPCGIKMVAHYTPETDFIMILNGDTIPQYDLRGVWEARSEKHPVMVFDKNLPRDYGAGLHAGVVLLHKSFLAQPLRFDENIWEFLLKEKYIAYYPPTFLDVGTPEGLKNARLTMGEQP